MEDHPRRRVVHPEGGEVKVKQSLTEATDINKIVERYAEFGEFPFGGSVNPKYGDFSDGYSYHDALSAIREAEIQFNALPARVREYCENDVGKFLDKVYDPKELAKLQALGLEDRQEPEDAPEAEKPAEPAEPAAQEGT